MVKKDLTLFKNLYLQKLLLSVLLSTFFPFTSGLAQGPGDKDTVQPGSAITLKSNNEVTPAIGTSTGWSMMGMTNTDNSPYSFYYYNLLQMNADNDRYESIIEVSVQRDENFYQKQGTYLIRVDKYEGISSRFDGLEIKCISGNPAAAIFYVYNNALWIRSNSQWGEIYYKIVGNFSRWSSVPSSLTGGTFGQTATAPTGYLVSTANYGLKCDFDHNIFYRLPYADVHGNMFVNGNIGIGTSAPQSKLAVNGTVTAKQVKVTQTGWPDYVFDTTYKLPALEDIRDFIKRHQHLPDIPSAKEIKSNGLDLGDMEKRQMQKIEELTLYVMRLQNEIEGLKIKINLMERSKIPADNVKK